MAKLSQTPQEEDIAEELNEQFLLSKRYLDPIHERMNQQEELYRTFIDKNNYPHNARVFDPRVFRIIETITPRMVANEPTGSFYPVEGGDVATTNILNALIKYDWRRADMFPKLVMFVKSMLIFGTAFGRTYYDYRTAQRTRMVPKTINGKTVWTPKNNEQVETTEFDGPNFEPLNIYDCFPDPNATSMSNMRWFIYRSFKTLKELENENETKPNYYKNLDKLKAAMANEDEDGDEEGSAQTRPDYIQYREHRRTMLSTQELIGQDDSNPDLVILRKFSRDRWVDVVAGYNIVIRDIENPYFHGEIPIVCGVDYPYPGDLYGMGEIEPVDRIQRAINAVLNQRLDNVQLTLRNMWKVKKGAGVDLHTLVSSPGNVITTDDMNAIEAVSVPDVTGPTFVQTMTYLTSAMQNGSGVTDYTVGVGNNTTVGNDTATGTRLIQQEANAQFKLKIQLFNHMVIQPIANQWKDLRIQYTTEEQKLRIIGKDDINYLRDNTNLSQVDMQGNPIAPGEQVPSKLEITGDGGLAFLNLLPDDIQPAIVGDYDFIAQVSADQLNDPIAMQQNFFLALDRVTNPAWQQMLAQQGKQLNAEGLTQKVFDKLQLGLEEKDVLTDVQQQPQIDPNTGMPIQDPNQPLTPDQTAPLKMPMQNPFANPLQGQEQAPLGVTNQGQIGAIGQQNG